MTRFRTHKKEVTVISNETIRGCTLSLEGIGLLAICLSMPPTWDFYPKKMWKEGYCSRDKLYRVFNELIEAGHCIRVAEPNPRIPHLPGEIEYEIFDDIEDCEKHCKELFENTKLFIQCSSKFKKFYRYPGKQDPKTEDPKPQDVYKERDKKETLDKETLLLPEPEIPKPPEIPDPPLPAGGNNNNSPVEIYKCLEPVNDMSPKQKSQFGRYDEKIVEAGVSYCYHPNTKLQGPQARIKQLHAYCQNPADYADTLKHLDDPPDKKMSNKEAVLKRYINRTVYSGFEFFSDQYGCGFIAPQEIRNGARDCWSIEWKDPGWYTKWCVIIENINIHLRKKHENKR